MRKLSSYVKKYGVVEGTKGLKMRQRKSGLSSAIERQKKRLAQAKPPTKGSP